MIILQLQKEKEDAAIAFKAKIDALELEHQQLKAASDNNDATFTKLQTMEEELNSSLKHQEELNAEFIKVCYHLIARIMLYLIVTKRKERIKRCIRRSISKR